MTLKDIQQKARKLISQGKTEESLKFLTQQINNNSIAGKELLLLTSRYNHIGQKSRTGIISSTDATIEVNKISHFLLEFIDRIEESDLVVVLQSTTAEPTEAVTQLPLDDRAGRDSLYPKPVTAKPNRGVTHFLGIGINAYASWPKLQNARRDVEAVASLLITDFGLDRRHVTLLLDEQATHEKIIKTLDDLVERVREPDSLIIYFAGHGHLNNKDRGYWIPLDASVESTDRYIRNSTIRDYLQDIRSLHTLLLCDACFSGSLFVRSLSRDIPLSAQELASLPSRWAICSGRHDQTVADGPLNGHSPFAQSLLDVLSNTERESITANFLMEQVTEQTRANSNQLPDGGPIEGVGHKRGQYVFYRTTAIAPVSTDTAAWMAVQALPEVTTAELDSKITALTRFCDEYPDSPHLDAALALGDALEHRQAFMDSSASQFKLRAFIRQHPDSPHKAEAETLLAQWNNKIERPTSPPTAAMMLPSTPAPNAPPLPAMVHIPGGTFQMGDVMGDGEYVNEKPIHSVTLSDFYLGRYAVTFAEYDAFCEAIGRKKPGDEGWGRERRPVINVNWYDAVDYCNWLSQQHGYTAVYDIQGDEVRPNWTANGYRLPTEAEWEYAARERGRKLRFGNGANQATSKEINFYALKDKRKEYSSAGEYRGQTVPVGSLEAPNRLGLHEMSGNVWEWCWDWLGDYSAEAQTNPYGTEEGSKRVRRGGSWHYSPQFCRAVFRFYGDPTDIDRSVGFRLARNHIAVEK